MDYFIADLHFGDGRILSYENRPFADVKEMDEELIRRWNERVTEEDTVYVLGDFSAYDQEKNKEILKRLKGRKVLIMGNHDRHQTAQAWRNAGFEECSQWPVIYKDFYMLSHEPLYINTNMPYANLYGHVHNNPSYKTASKQSVCVSVERIDYTPISMEEVTERMKDGRF
ncbi:MAG: metallophosphoesterase [Acetatifactor sp.]|nr:metallophosphoesterase [Acetatifactor sp.]